MLIQRVAPLRRFLAVTLLAAGSLASLGACASAGGGAGRSASLPRVRMLSMERPDLSSRSASLSPSQIDI
jgi:hypothetical protein